MINESEVYHVLTPRLDIQVTVRPTTVPIRTVPPTQTVAEDLPSPHSETDVAAMAADDTRIPKAAARRDDQGADIPEHIPLEARAPYGLVHQRTLRWDGVSGAVVSNIVITPKRRSKQFSITTTVRGRIYPAGTREYIRLGEALRIIHELFVNNYHNLYAALLDTSCIDEETT